MKFEDDESPVEQDIYGEKKLSEQETMESSGVPVDYDASMDEELPEDTNIRGISSGFTINQKDEGYTYTEPELSEEEEEDKIASAIIGVSASSLDSLGDLLDSLEDDELDDIISELNSGMVYEDEDDNEIVGGPDASYPINISIQFGNWLSKNYNIENGIGFWTDHEDNNVEYTTEELWEKFNRRKHSNVVI